METQMAADVFPQVRQRSAKVVRTRVRTFAQMAAEDVRRYAPSAVKHCARLAGLLRKFRRWQIIAQAAVSQRRRKRKRNCRRIAAAAAGCSAGRWRREMSGHKNASGVCTTDRVHRGVTATERLCMWCDSHRKAAHWRDSHGTACSGVTASGSGVTATQLECSGGTAAGWHTGGMGATD